MGLALVIGIIIGILILRFAIGFLFKFFGILLVVGCLGIYCYQKAYWPFDKNLASITLLEEKYCEGESAKPHKCECIVKVLEKDINKRFTKEEIKALDANRIKSAYLIKRSLDYCEPQIKKCLSKKKSEGELEEFKMEMLKLDQSGIGALSEWLKKKKQTVSETINGVKIEKEDVDKKYED
jgi:hypothetical protein